MSSRYRAGIQSKGGALACSVPSVDASLGEAWRRPFVPLFRDPHVQTIAGRYWPVRFDEVTWPTRERYFATEPAVRILAHCNVQAPGLKSSLRNRLASSAGGASGGPAPVVLAVHGLTASSQAPYMRSLAQRALLAGFDVIRLNVRNCGGTEHLAPTLYHSGLTADLRAVVEQLAPRPLYLAGFSMGGNMVLKLAGEWRGQPPPHVRAVCGVSVPIRLDVCARRLGEPCNRIYEIRFLRELRRTLKRKRQVMPELFPAPLPERIGSIYEFDDTVTAPAFGFRSADHYYETQSSAGFLGAIRVPALLIQAQDDPFIPFDVFEDVKPEKNRCARLEAPEYGGHVAFLAKGTPRFWAIEQAVRFFESTPAGRSLHSERQE
jgi:predicted alpha/beta-fold hydrolase